jgi:AP-2 complex subunit alpha
MSNNQQSHGIRGLSIFIGDIRASKTKDAEIKVVQKEMAKIRQKFQNKGLAGYDKKKYVWKLIYAHILGYEVEFGHEEALNLINAQKFTEKSTGYIAIGIMLNEKSNFQLFERVLNAVKVDLNCGNEICEGLALATLGNIGFPEMVPELAPIVVKKVFSPGTNSYVRKRAIMCLLSFLRRNRSIYNQQEWERGFRFLLDQKHKGILMSTCSLMMGVINIMGREGLYDLVPQIINVLATIKSDSNDYIYYKTPCPWLQVKALKLLQHFPPPENKRDLTVINELIMKIINNTEATKDVNKNNSDHSILFEAFNLIIHYGDSAFEVLRQDTIKLMASFVDVREPNIRYLALETMSRMNNIDRKKQLIHKFKKIFFKNLRDRDISIRKIALNSLFGLCDEKVSGDVVNELLDYLHEGNDYELKEEIVLKVAILAEKFAENLNWYIDVIIKLIEYAGDYVNEDLWFRVAQIITGFG